MQIGERIAKRRKELGLSQEQLAHRMGYKSKAAISKIETNVNDVTQTSVIKFAEALDTSVAYLMGWDEKPKELDLQFFAKEEEDPHEIRMIARAGKKMSPEKRAEMLRVLKAIFPEEFEE